MNRDTSIFLDGARFLAALTVVAGHIEWTFAPGFMPFIRRYHLATLAVGIFFVLSGFVISYVVDRNETDACSYFLNRAARIYSVVVPVLLLTLLLDTCGRWLAPDAYNETLNVWNVFKELLKLLVSLTFVNQAWHLSIQAGDNVPFWSLAYEVPYYVVFGLWYFGGNRLWRFWWLQDRISLHFSAFGSLGLAAIGCATGYHSHEHRGGNYFFSAPFASGWRRTLPISSRRIRRSAAVSLGLANFSL